MNENNYKERLISANTSQLAVILQPYQKHSPEDMPGEVWRDVVGYEGYYQVSNFGNVRSVARNKNSKRGHNGRYLKLSAGSTKRLRVTLTQDGIRKMYDVHRLVAMSFLPNAENYPQINHIDGDYLNNRASNLEWCTREYNERHAKINGLKPSGERVGGSKLNKDKVIEIFLSELSYNELSKKYGVTINAISSIKRGYTWRSVTGISRIIDAKDLKGEKSKTAKLTESQALAILHSADKVSKLAHRYNISRDTVYHIKSKKSWKHLR